MNSKDIKKSLKEKLKNIPSDSDSDNNFKTSKSKLQTMDQRDFYKETKRRYSVSIVVPSSIIDNAQSLELKTYLVG